ncbi:MAG: DUF4097 family beta strand repeat protein [Clostridia bacterium]|nr:DUF4097 family beta strand repeat protein [Clostridia bacterium]
MKRNLKIYLESLFINAPKTPTNDALFEELLGNLCDRYDELCAEGLTPDAAYARVIGEVGDIRPLLEGVAENGAAADYPPHSETKSSTPPPFYNTPQKKGKKVRLSPEALRRAKCLQGMATAAAVMLFILWLVPVMIWEAVAPLFICVALGVVILVLAGTLLPDYADDSKLSYDENTCKNDTRVANILQATGIGLLILCILPAATIYTNWGAGLMFLCIAIGVGMLIFAAFLRPSLDKSAVAKIAAAPQGDKAAPLIFTDATKEKRNRLILPIVLISIIAVITVCIFVAGSYGLPFGLFTHGIDANLSKYTNHGNATMTAPVERLSISWTAGHVTVEPYDGETVEIYETQNGNTVAEVNDEMHWFLEDGHLRIRFDGKGYFRFGFKKQQEKQLIVRVPRSSTLLASLSLDVVSADLTVKGIGTKGALSVSSVSGNATLTDISAKLFRYDAVSGALSLTNGQLSHINVDTTSGNVTLANATATECDFDTTSGNITLLDCAFGSIDADTTSGDLCITSPQALASLSFDTTGGDLLLTLPADHAGFTAELDTTGGEFASDFPTTTAEDTHRTGDGSLQIEMDSTGGNLTIKKAA